MKPIERQVIDLINSWYKHRDIARRVGIAVWKVSNIRNKFPNELTFHEQENRVWWSTVVREEDWFHEINHVSEEIRTKDQFMEHINFDSDAFEIISYQANIRPVVIRANKNETKIVNKYEHFLRSKPKLSVNMESIIDIFDKKIKSIKFESKRNIKPNKDWKLLELCLFDAHINKKSYDNEYWDSDIATTTYLDMIDNMLDRAMKIDTYERCLLIIGNDFLNSDALSKTTRWTPQDSTESEEESFAYWLAILTRAIERIQERLNCIVDVMSIPWNHAQLLETVMWVALRQIYRGNPNVHVDCDFKPRKYYQYGNTVIMFSHWDGCRQDKIPMLFANEAPELRWQSKYRQVHLGHIHTKTVSEVNWVIIRHLSSMTTTDKRHMEQWYVWNRRWWQMFIFDKEIWEEWEFNFYV